MEPRCCFSSKFKATLMDTRQNNNLNKQDPQRVRNHESVNSPSIPDKEEAVCQDWAARTGGDPTPSSTPHSGLGAARTARSLRTPGPTPYLRRERKEQQQRAGRRWHRAQRLLLQSQNILEAPLAGDPQPGQHFVQHLGVNLHWFELHLRGRRNEHNPEKRKNSERSRPGCSYKAPA